MNAENRADKSPVSKQPDYHELAVKNRARVDKWLAEGSIAPEWQIYNKFMASISEEDKEGLPEGKWPDGTAQLVIDLYTKTTSREKKFKDTLGFHPSVEEVLVRTPDDIRMLEEKDKRDHEKMKEKVLDVLETLTGRERRVLRLSFGLDDGRGHRPAEIAKELGVSVSTIRRDQKRALEKLRKKSGKKLRDYLE